MNDDYLKNLSMLPEHMRGAMQRWIENGIPPGSFLTAVLSNDMQGAIGRADHINRNALPAYASYLYSYAPADCHGSPANVAAWTGIKNAGSVDTDRN